MNECILGNIEELSAQIKSHSAPRSISAAGQLIVETHSNARYELMYLELCPLTEHKDTDKVTLNCSVSTDRGCEHRVKWLYQGEDLDKDDEYRDTSEPKCSVTVTFPTSDLNLKSEIHECEVTDLFVQPVLQYTFSLQSSGEKPEDATTATTPTTTTPTTATTTLRIIKIINQTSTNSIGWWLYIIVAVGFIALVVIIVTAIRCKRTKGNKTKMDENTGQRLKPLVTESAPETTQDTADPEDGVSYASISFTKKTNSKGRVQVKNDDDGEDTVTYSTVKASSSSAGASDDHSNLYATINKK
ncbi:uncharacterized protein LOC118341011 [Morone saxatilis]|uniref:uncharacterized protein LOC118341011 n=1 Tax=Morone saxatilis TaxID=34816 RepID=UPI0015E21FF6|nr:uncharacterized protein LOC118341011 [Morone saxatilis]